MLLVGSHRFPWKGLLFGEGLFLLLAPGLLGEGLKPPVVAAWEGGRVIALQEGKPRWEQEWSLEKLENQVRFTEKGRGRYAPFSREVGWTAESAWELQPRFRPLRWRREFSDPAGQLLLVETIDLDWTEGVARFQRQDLKKGDRQRKRLRIPADTLIVSGLATALRGFPFEAGGSVKVSLLTDEPALYRVELKSEGRKEVTVPAGSFSCVELSLDPKLGFLSVFKFLVPETRFWFALEPPHSWVRYVGPERGRGSPSVDIRLVEFQAGEAGSGPLPGKEPGHSTPGSSR